MRKYGLFAFFLLIHFFGQSCFALQTVSIADNQTKNITVSAYELSRIFVKDDRIQNVRGLEGAYVLTKDTALGQIYIKPTLLYQVKPFNLFITTEKARNFNLFVTADGIAGQDIEIRPSTPSKEAEVWEKNSDYSQVLIKLITGMINDEVPSGYSIIYPDKKTRAVKYDNFTTKLQKRYLGKHLCGEVLLIQNRRNYPISLTEDMFYQATTRAVTFLNSTISAGGQTMVFRVVSDE